MNHSTNGYYRCSVLTNIIQYYVAHCLADIIITLSLNLTSVCYKYQYARSEGKPKSRTDVVMTYWPVSTMHTSVAVAVDYDGLKVKIEGLEENH